MDDSPLPPKKKELSPLAWLGIGRGGVLIIAVIGIILVSVLFGGQIKQFAGEVEKNPTRAVATMMVKASGGLFEFVAEDDVNKRYTVREKKTGKLTTVYWDEKTKKPVVAEGDFTSLPAPGNPSGSSTPAPAL